MQIKQYKSIPFKVEAFEWDGSVKEAEAICQAFPDQFLIGEKEHRKVGAATILENGNTFTGLYAVVDGVGVYPVSTKDKIFRREGDKAFATFNAEEFDKMFRLIG